MTQIFLLIIEIRASQTAYKSLIRTLTRQLLQCHQSIIVTMPRGPLLSEFERGQVTALRESGCSMREIARRLKRSIRVISNYLASPDNYGKNHAGGKPKALSERDKRQILRLASNSKYSLKKIKALSGV